MSVRALELFFIQNGCVIRGRGVWEERDWVREIGLVKIESDFIVRPVETGLGRRMLVVAVISVDAYPVLE